jgi:hypothetical protein
MKERLSHMQPSEVASVARILATHQDELSAWEGLIEEAIVAKASHASLTPDFPPSTLLRVLQARPDLIDADILSGLSNSSLEALLTADSALDTVVSVARELVKRDLGQSEDRLLNSQSIELFRSAVDAFAQGSLHNSWLSSIPRNQAAILRSAWLDVFRSTGDLAKAIQVLRYPRHLNKSAEELYEKLRALPDDAQGPDRADLQAFLLRAAFDNGSSSSWKLIQSVLPELRSLILQDSLPPTAHSILSDDLPRFYSAAYWDLNRRILLGLSKLHKDFPDATVRDLHLSDGEMNLVLAGEEEERRKSWWPWS